MVLNVSAIKKAIATAQSRTYGSDKSRMKGASSVGKRTELVNPSLAKKIARQKQQRLIGRDLGNIEIDVTRGQALKKGVIGMLDRALIPDEIAAKISKMDPEKLDALYQQNDLIFEVYFDYGGIESGEDGAYHIDRGKKIRDAQFLVSQYEKTFGKIAV